MGKTANHVAKTDHILFKRGKNLISEAAPSQLLPNLFNRIHFRRIWRNKKQAYVFRTAEGAGLVPCGTVATEENDVIWILLHQVAQEKVHANCIAVWQDQETALPGNRFDSPVGITIFPDVMTRNRWADALWAPAEFGLVNPPKARSSWNIRRTFPLFPQRLWISFSNSPTFSFIFLRPL